MFLAGEGAAASTALGGFFGSGPTSIVMLIVVYGAIIYFLFIRPQKKQQKEQQELFSSLAIGDYVLTSSGFYGEIIDVANDTVIVEFGNNKNCRIPMQKSAIVKSEKPNFSKEKKEEDKK